MTGYLARRLLQALVVIFGVTLIVFALSHLLPGGPARAMLGPRATPQQIHSFIVANGFDKPLPVQYYHYIGQLLTGNLGYSYKYNQTVNSLLALYLPRSIILVGLATVLAITVAVPLGVYQAIRRNRADDYVLTGASFLFYAMPVYWLGYLLILAFSVKTHILPSEAPQVSDIAGLFSNWQGLVLPVVTLALVSIALFSRYQRSAALENLAQDYIRTARAKGVSERAVIIRHLLRNSLIPIATLLGLSLPGLVAGALLTETVFNFPGVGLLFWNAALTHDYPILLGVTLIVGIATVLGSLLADLLYAVLDPRVRYS